MERGEVDSSAQRGPWGLPDLNTLEETDGECPAVGVPFDNVGFLVEVEMCEDHFACNVDEKSTSFDIGGQKMVAVGTEGATNDVLAVLNGKCDGCVAKK